MPKCTPVLTEAEERRACTEGPTKLSQCTPKPGLLPEACPPVTLVGNYPHLPGAPISSPTQSPLSAQNVQGPTHGFRNLPHPLVCAQVRAHSCSQDPTRQST